MLIKESLPYLLCLLAVAVHPTASQQPTTTPFPYNDYTAQCPPAAVTEPCYCRLYHGIDSEIMCDTGVAPLNLTALFQRIADHLRDQHRARISNYTYLTLKSTAVTELGDNAFRGVPLNAVYLQGATGIRRISANAFHGTETLIEKYYHEGPNAMPDTAYPEFFAALNSLVNLKTVMFLDASVKAIPDGAFSIVQTKLEKLMFTVDAAKGAVARIGAKSFAGLNGLTTLDLGEQSLTRIVSEAFAFAEPSPSDAILTIKLNDNQLNGSSFESGSFALIRRPVSVILDNNKIAYLDEQAFRPLLTADKRNTVALNGRQLDCADCRNSWLARDRATLSKQAPNIYCSTNKTVWDTSVTFSGCS